MRARFRLTWLAMLALLAACGSAPKQTETPTPSAMVAPAAPVPPDPGTDARLSQDALVLVRYATNRAGSGDDCDPKNYRNEPHATVRSSGCWVAMPVNRAVGELPTDKSDKRDNARMVRAMGQPEPLRQKALLFVHGFNVDFSESVLRAAQIAHDLKWPGDVWVYSWPAGRNCSLVNPTCMVKTYQDNQASAAKTVPMLTQWLTDMGQRYAPGNVNLLVHSMGHQLAVPALKQWVQSGQPAMNTVFFNAPDYDWRRFLADAPTVRKAAKQFTVYCSFKDKALGASALWSGNPRLGECEQLTGYDVINVSGLSTSLVDLGHGYYYSRPIVMDMKDTMAGIPPENRLFVVRASAKGSETHFLRP